ncbi:phosphopentomutase [Oryzibacter oryziterrae]|uniref:phosphopentomutase n=1 Tax=Oryzibacter oryziterrae TaxID=2766474 RepID=UPI001F005275|nr:phosphopentomutase [Oryzibacter oryziterrae]
MPRAIVIVLDSFGIGGAPDAEKFGDKGSDTLGHIAAACATGAGDREGLRAGPLRLPNLERLGLGLAAEQATGNRPVGFALTEAQGRYTAAAETSSGKDTPSGHWEIAGVPVPFDWGYFPNEIPCLPQELIDAYIRETGVPGVLGLRHASGTEVIESLGEEHIKTGKPILYTSADSVLQIAAHETHFGLDRLLEHCQIARKLVDRYNIGRVIARPFLGETASTFKRTSNRRDYAVPPPEPTVLARVEAAGGRVIGIGKIGDIFAHTNITELRKGKNNDDNIDLTLAAMNDARSGDFIFTNLVDFDSSFGHRRDVPGYAACLESFDRRLPEVEALLQPDDLLLLTADHGCDPTWPGTDHTRERVPVLMAGARVVPGSAGPSETFADMAETIAAWLGLPKGPHGKSLI